MIVAALVGGCSDGGGSNDAGEEIFGGTPPSDEELATYPKLLPAEAFASDGGVAAAAITAGVPPSFVIPESTLPPVQAQGTPTNDGYPGSCEVWSAGYAMGSYAANITNQKDIRNLANTVSTAYVYMTALSETSASCGNGTSPGLTLNYLVDNTAPSLASIPYYPVCACPPGSDQCLEAIALDQSCASNPEFCTDLTIGSWSAVAKQPIEQVLAIIKTWLATSHVVQISIVVPYDFKDYVSGVYDAPASCPSQPSKCTEYRGIACIASTKEPSGCAQHGVAIVGYDDERGALKIQNSFGTAWGEQGYMWMSYSTFEAIYLAATIAFPPPASSASSASGLATSSAAADAGFQWVERGDAATPKTHLIFASTLDRPVELGAITITTPDGSAIEHTYGHWFRKGHHYVTRHDGNQFPAGTYQLRLQGTTRSGETVTFTSALEVALAPGEPLPAAPLGDGITGTNGRPVR